MILLTIIFSFLYNSLTVLKLLFFFFFFRLEWRVMAALAIIKITKIIKITVTALLAEDKNSKICEKRRKIRKGWENGEKWDVVDESEK